MPQLVREVLYFSHREHGVEMGESISLCGVSRRLGEGKSMAASPVPSFDIVVVATYELVVSADSMAATRSEEGNITNPSQHLR